MAGLEANRVPPEGLEGTPFNDYVVPGLILAGAVGGSAALSVAALLARGGPGPAVSIAAGAILIAYVAVEVRILAQPSAPTRTEVFYLAVGATMIALATVAVSVG